MDGARLTGPGICPPVGRAPNFSIRRFLRRSAGIDIHRVPPGNRNGTLRPVTKSSGPSEVDESFNRIVDAAIEAAGSGPAGEGDGARAQRHKLFNLVQALDLTAGVQGIVAECGCFQGLSAYVTCARLTEQGVGQGRDYHVFDSFEGISAPDDKDGLGDPAIPIGKVKRAKGMFKASLDQVKETLALYPEVTFHPGWIPESLAGAPDGPYRFVHLDLDVHQPTSDALRFFHPRLAPGGLIVCDDYGAVRWPGVRDAVDTYAAANGGTRVLPLSSCQALVFATGS